MINLRCRLGRHQFVRTTALWYDVARGLQSLTNARCTRCGRRGWLNTGGAEAIPRR